METIKFTLQTISLIQSSVIFIWIPGHNDHPQHDAVDLGAKNTTLFSKITDPCPSPAHDLKNHNRSIILTAWRIQWKNKPNNILRTIKTNLSLNHVMEKLSSLTSGLGSRPTHSHLLQGLHSTSNSNSFHTDHLAVQHFSPCLVLKNLRTSFNVPLIK